MTVCFLSWARHWNNCSEKNTTGLKVTFLEECIWPWMQSLILLTTKNRKDSYGWNCIPDIAAQNPQKISNKPGNFLFTWNMCEFMSWSVLLMVLLLVFGLSWQNFLKKRERLREGYFWDNIDVNSVKLCMMIVCTHWTLLIISKF